MATIEEKEARKREIEQRHSRICADYVALLNEGKHTPHSIFETLAQKYLKLLRIACFHATSYKIFFGYKKKSDRHFRR